MKDIYILKEMNETYSKRIYADNWLKQFKSRNVENLLTKQIEIHEMLNITSENSIDAMKKSNIINKDIRINDKVRSEIVRNAVENDHNLKSCLFKFLKLSTFIFFYQLNSLNFLLFDLTDFFLHQLNSLNLLSLDLTRLFEQ